MHGPNRNCRTKRRAAIWRISIGAFTRLAVPRAALCLSGGGIRSASFALGVLQALARHGLLRHFHYLSTVSGGGYIGSWLSAWRFHERDDDAVFAKLIERGGYSVEQNDTFAEPAELGELRANSNFLTPKLGLLSADTWTAIALYIRNFLLNWFIFGPMFLSIALVPHASFDVLIWLNNAFGTVNRVVLGIAAVLLLIGLGMSIAGRPLRDRPSQDGLSERQIAPDNQRFVYFVLLPIYLGAGVLATFTAWLPTTPDAMHWGIVVETNGNRTLYPILYAIVIGAILYGAAWFIGFFTSGGRSPELFRIIGTRRNPVPPLAEMVCYAVSGAAAGAVTAIGIGLYQHLSGLAETGEASALIAFLFHGYSRIYMVVAGGVAWTMTAILTADLLFTGLTSYHRYGEADREWSARAAGYLAAAAIGWLLFAAIVLYGPPASSILLAMVGGVAGLVTLALGSSAKTAATVARQVTERLSITAILSFATTHFRSGAADPDIQARPQRARLCRGDLGRPGELRCEGLDRHDRFAALRRGSSACLILDQRQPLFAARSLPQQAHPGISRGGAGKPSRQRQNPQQSRPVHRFRSNRQSASDLALGPRRE